MDKIYKSSLVVWTTEKMPVIETFHADTEEEIEQLQGEWMTENGYTKGHMTLYAKNDGEWKVLNKGQFHNFLFPEFAFLNCAPHEEEKIKEYMKYKVIQLATGRIVNIVPEEKSDRSGFINKLLTISVNENKELKYIAELLKFSEEDMEIMEEKGGKELMAQLDKDFFYPLGEWVVKNLEHSFKNE